MSKEDTLYNRMNERILNLKPSSILDFNTEMSQIDGIIKLTLGEPDFNTPEHVKKAAIKAIENNDTHYSPAKGTVSLRKAIAKFLSDKYDLTYDPETEVIVTDGVSEGLYATMAAIINPGDEIILPSPFFGPYAPDVEFNGGTPVFIDTSKTNFHLSADVLRETLKTHPDAKGILLNFPNNPTGTSYTDDELENFGDILAQYDIFVLSDEIYSELSYAHKHLSLAKLLPDQTILLNGVSKSHAMTGWRIGYLAGPAKLVDKIAEVGQFMVFSVDTLAQDAAEEALKNGEDDAVPMKKEYLKRQKYMLQALRNLGFEVVQPQGAFYLFVKVPDSYDGNDEKFCLDMAHQAGVAAVPGKYFGPGGQGYFRISYATSMENLGEAVKRITDWIGK